mmetsp:Transcript_7743/g.7193  ORF Transcript_7743/g.7193 Transcript_7743/m.7193 type:complete len:186 (-) Transcript_7743:247-804(-)
MEIKKQLDFSLKFVDMGNACYIDNHFSDIIQTREYRSPEVILNGDYDTSADMWSLACMVFELVTGDYLFDPKKGKNYKKNDDHLALICELIGECPNVEFLLSGEDSEDFFDKKGKLKKIQSLKFWSLYHVLIEKYKLKELEAKGLNDFMMKMLQWEPSKRATAKDMLSHYWLKMIPDYECQMSKP